MKVTLKQTYTWLFFLGIFFIPFNSYEGVSFLGEFKRDGAILFFLASFLIFSIDVLYKGKLSFPYKNIFIHLLLVFLVWLLFSTLVNGYNIYGSVLKSTTGISRFVRQLIALSLSLIIFLTAYNISINFSVKQLFFKIRRMFLYSFVVVVFYGIIETMIVYFKITSLKPIILIFNYLPFLDVYLDINWGRISSITYEPPFLAIYLITIAGWMFSYIVTSKGIKKYLPTLFVFALTFFSGSRTALVVVLFQFFVFISVTFTLKRKFRDLINKFLIIGGALFLIIFIFNSKKVTEAIETKIESLNFKDNLISNISNRSRFGIQYTSLLIYKDNPVFGVGFGQQAYHAKNRYPKWATENNYEFQLYYLNENERSFPPGYNMYTRLLAETGSVGFLIFISFILFIFYQCKKMIKSRKGVEKIIPLILLVSFVGFSINWLQFDSFRVFGFWICLAVLIRQVNEKKYE